MSWWQTAFVAWLGLNVALVLLLWVRSLRRWAHVATLPGGQTYEVSRHFWRSKALEGALAANQEQGAVMHGVREVGG